MRLILHKKGPQECITLRRAHKKLCTSSGFLLKLRIEKIMGRFRSNKYVHDNRKDQRLREVKLHSSHCRRQDDILIEGNSRTPRGENVARSSRI